MEAIELDHLSKRYASRLALDDVTFSVPAGAIFGFIGPNGAGKTTTIRILLDLLAATGGSARLFGVASSDPRARLGVGYAAGDPQLPPNTTAGAVLEYLGRLQPGDSTKRRVELARCFELELEARTDDLSLGTKKKLALIAALQHGPRLIVLDEPTSALDPVVRARLFEVLRDAVDRGATVFLSSHVLADVEALCQTVAIVGHGRLVALDDVVRLRERAMRHVYASFDGGGSQAALARLAQRLGVDQLESHGKVMTFLYRGPVPPLLDALAASAPSDVRIEVPSLEDVFLADFAYVEQARVA